MKRLFAKLCIVALACIFAGSANFALKWHTAVDAANRIYTIPKDKPIVCLGASHIECSIADTQDYCQHKKIWLSSFRSNAVLMRLLELERRNQLANATCLVTEIAPWAFAESDKPDDVEREAKFWMRELPLNWRYYRLFPFGKLVYAETLLEFFEKNAMRPMRNPFTICESLRTERPQLISMPKDWQDERFDHYRNLHYGDYESQKDILEIQFSIYSEIMEVCRRHDMRVLFMVSPLSSRYRSFIPNLALSRMERFLEGMRTKGVIILDRSADYSDEMFYDPTHLTFDGSLVFTEELYRVLKDNGCIADYGKSMKDSRK